MALRPKLIYAGQVDESDAAYPEGKAQNDLVEGDGFGTPLEAQLVNEIFGSQQALLEDAGIEPNDLPEKVGASQYLEAVKAVGGQYVLTHRALQEWSKQDLPITEDHIEDSFPFLVDVTLPGVSERAVVAIGNDGGLNLAYVRSLGSAFFEASVLHSGVGPGSSLSGAFSVASGKDGEFLSTYLNRIVSHTSLTTRDITSGAGLDFIGYSKFYSKYYNALTAAKSGLITSIRAGSAIGSLSNIGGTDPCSSFSVSALGLPSGRFLENGNGVVLLVGECLVSGVTRDRIVRSGDGDTFAVVYTAGAGVKLDVVWSEETGQFVGLDSDGKILTSSDGVTWANPRTVGALSAANGGSTYRGTLACSGKVIAKAFNPLYYTGINASGIAYSLDVGKTWHVVHLADADGIFGADFGVHTLIAANDRFYATDCKRVYRSGVIGFGLPDFIST